MMIYVTDEKGNRFVVKETNQGEAWYICEGGYSVPKKHGTIEVVP
jgi:hypothetical protein